MSKHDLYCVMIELKGTNYLTTIEPFIHDGGIITRVFLPLNHIRN